MQKRDKYKAYIGSMLLALIILINVYVAARYYFLESARLSQFFIWQTNIEKVVDK